MKKIIYTRPLDGGLSIVNPAPQAQLKDESEDDFIQRIFDKDVPEDAINPQIIDESELPDLQIDPEITDLQEIMIEKRHFRDGWVFNNGKVEHDMDKCREIQKAKMRVERKPLLEKLDTDFMRALEDGDSESMTTIKDKKQTLRDVTAHPDIAAAETPEELKKVWPF